MMRYFYFSILVALILVSCSTTGENPATETARQVTVVARATTMARALRSTDVARITQATATAQAWQDELRSVARWPLLVQEAFDDNSLEWVIGEDTGEYADIVWQIKDGKYIWDATARQGFVWWNRPELDEAGDFYASVDARQISGVETGQMGLFFRQSVDSRYYTFTLRGDGMFSLDWHDEDGWTSLMDWTQSEAVRMDQSNRLGVLARGNQLALLINDQLVAEYSTDYALAGSLGLLIGMDDEGDEGVFEFDNFEVRVPELPQETPTP